MGYHKREGPARRANRSEAKTNLPHHEYNGLPLDNQADRGPEHIAVIAARVVANLVRRMEARP